MLLYAEIVFAIFTNVISQILYYWLNLTETLQSGLSAQEMSKSGSLSLH